VPSGEACGGQSIPCVCVKAPFSTDATARRGPPEQVLVLVVLVGGGRGGGSS